MSKVTVEAPDHILVLAAILGDLEAFDELASRYRSAVVRTAQAIVGRDYAEDVAQDALLLAFKALPSIEEPDRFGSWLCAITRHRAIRFGKRERSHQTGRVELDEVLLEQVSALSRPLIDHRNLDDDVTRALEKVPVDYATVLRLRFQDEMPLKRIAAFLGVQISTVKWRIHRGKQLLREQLGLMEKRGESWNEKDR